MASRSIHAELFSKIVAERCNADAIERGSPRNKFCRTEKSRENKCISFLDVHVIFTNRNDIFNLVLEFFHRLLSTHGV